MWRKFYRAVCIKAYRLKTFHIKKNEMLDLTDDDVKSWLERGYITRSNSVYDPVILGKDVIKVYEVTEMYREIINEK